MSDGRFHNPGLGFHGRELLDPGRYDVTGDAADVAVFSTPSLRHAARHRPYMHNGLMPNLRSVAAFCNAGGVRPKPAEGQAEDPLYPKTSALLKPPRLNRNEVEALVAFLEAL